MDNSVMRKARVLNAIKNGHVDILKAYLEGEIIEHLKISTRLWEVTGEPSFFNISKYRVKPEEPKELAIYIHRHKDTGNLMSSMYKKTGHWKLMDIIIYKEK